jgi:hypothetical protein
MKASVRSSIDQGGGKRRGITASVALAIFPCAPNRNFWKAATPRKCEKFLIYMVPGERIELPTNGLQNRCSTAELTRQYEVSYTVTDEFATGWC